MAFNIDETQTFWAQNPKLVRRRSNKYTRDKMTTRALSPMFHAFVQEVTGKAVFVGRWTEQTQEKMELAAASDLLLLHEYLHWLVATDHERACHNLLLDTTTVENYGFPWSGQTNRVQDRELEVMYLTASVFELLPVERRTAMKRELDREAEVWIDIACCGLKPAQMQRIRRRLNETGRTLADIAASMS